jgi:hypothetical protein
MTPVICQTVSWSPWMVYLRAKIPDLIEVVDTKRWAAHTFLECRHKQGDGPAIHIEDDIILTKDFRAKAEAVIATRPGEVIQFFSMRAADGVTGSRWDRAFLMNQCVYIPPGAAPSIVHFGVQWMLDHPENPNPDSLLRDWLKARRQRYWLHVPSLVQHRHAPSRLGPRSTYRQSATFTDPDY